MKRFLLVLFASITLSGVLAGCGTDDDKSAQAQSDGVKKVKVAYAQAGKPVSWLDEKGNATGYDVEVMRAVDEYLEEYEFEFVPTSDDDLLIGVEQGKYDIGLKNAFWTEERTEKFIYPKEFLGLSSTGLVLKKENEHIKNLEDFAKAQLKLAPIAANNAQYAIVDEFNKENPDNPVKLVAGDTFSVDISQWINEGRVDGGVMIEGTFNRQVLDEGAPYANLKDELIYNEFAVIKTWPLFNKGQQDLADAYDKAIQKVKEEKKTSEFSKEFYGKDLFEVLDSVTR